MKAKITRITMGPSSFDDNPWWDQVANGHLGLRYSLTLSMIVDGIGLTEARASVSAGHWTPEEGVRLNTLNGPFPTDKVTGTVTPVDGEAWREYRHKFTAFPLFKEGEFAGAESMGDIEVPPCACEAFLNTGLGWTVDIPDEAVAVKLGSDGTPARRRWTGANGVNHEVVEATVRGFTTDWLAPPPPKVAAVFELKAARSKERRGVLGQPPAFVLKHR